MSIIEIEKLVKIYKPMRMTRKDKKEHKSKQGPKVAVNNISFSVEQGETIGYIGPNGAGKSTTIKMLTGILHPTSGKVEVFGKIPHKNRRSNSQNIGVLFGQRSQLWQDLHIKDVFRLHKTLYDMGNDTFLSQQKKLIKILDLESFAERQVRRLSLGQRMRGELALSMLHKPKILYLDEPTIGMDALVKERIREHLLMLNKTEGITIMLTSHDLTEIERTCKRVILINSGKILYDGSMETLRSRCSADAIVKIQLRSMPQDIAKKLRGFKVLEDGHVQFLLNRSMGENVLLSEILSKTYVYDLTITEPSIEDVIRSLYEENPE